MIPGMSRREVTLREWWEIRRDEWAADGCRPVTIHAVVEARKLHRHDFPKASKVTPPNTAYYYLTDLDRWKKAHPGLFRGTQDS